MYESTQVKWIPAMEWTWVVELVKRSNVNDEFDNVNYSGISTLLLARLKSHRSNIDCIEGMPTIRYTKKTPVNLYSSVLTGHGNDGCQ